MNYNKFKSSLSRNYYNFRGKNVDQKIVVFESDDWGTIRMPSKATYEKSLDYGIRVDKCHYNRYDSLASEDDLSALFEVLVKFKDQNGNHPVITANSLVANPDFKKIKDSDFTEYHYEFFTDTLRKYPRHYRSFDLWKEGINNGIFVPQFHGREHLNVSRWMNALKCNYKETHFAFNNDFFGISTTISTENRKSYMAAYDFDSYNEIKNQINIIADGLEIFENIFGFRSKSFIAPNYIWHPKLEETLYIKGVQLIQGRSKQVVPINENKKKIISHYYGTTNKYKQKYLIRNATFEPASNSKINWVDYCIKQVTNAFFWQKPAIITSHRVNFIGFIDEKNRRYNLNLLEDLLRKLLKKFPDVIFLSTQELLN